MRFFLCVHAQLFENQGDENPIMLPLLLCQSKLAAHMGIVHTLLDRGSIQLLSILCPAAHCLNLLWGETWSLTAPVLCFSSSALC